MTDAGPPLGLDLLALVRARPAQLVAWANVSTLPSPVRRRAAYRLDFADGSTLKGRRLETAERAGRVARILDLIGDRIPGAFPRVLARRGEALLLEWIEGRPLDGGPVAPDVLERCGRVLGSLHRLALPDWPDVAVRTPADLLAKLGRDTDVLAAEGYLDHGVCRAAMDGATSALPAEPSLGIVHKDYCAENLVVTGAGDPVAVDNAALALAPHDLDLARTWYRWAMRPVERERFLAGYAERRDTGAFEERFPFWAICVLAGSAASRVRARTGRHAEPLDRLLRVLRRLDQGAGGPALWTA